MPHSCPARLIEMSSRPAFEQPQDLVAAHVGLEELGVGLEVREQGVAVAREAEEVVLLLDPLRLGAVDRAEAVHQVLLRLEGLARHAVRPLVERVVQIAAVGDPLHHRADAVAVPLLGRADEIVEGNLEPPPDVPELPLHLVAVDDRVEAALDGPAVDVLRVLVVAHDEMRLDAAETLVTGDDVGGDLFVRRPEVGPAVDVVDGGGQVEARHTSLGSSGVRGTDQARRERQ